jgi:hypothetical protein
MPSINNPSQVNNPDITTAAFDSFYAPQTYPVDAGTYDASVAFFIASGRNPTEAKRLTDVVFRIANDLSLSVQELLKQIESKGDTDIESQLTYYLNLTNNPATLQGITGPIQPNFYAARTVLD